MGHEICVQLFTVLLADTLVHCGVHLLVGDWFVCSRSVGEHLVDGVSQLTPEDVTVVVRTHVVVDAG